MSDRRLDLRGLAAELKRRRVIQVVAAYAVAVFAAIQVIDILVPILGLADGTLRFVVLVCVAALPVVIVLSWVFDITPEGVVRTPATEGGEEPSEAPAPPSAAHVRRANAGYVGIGILVALAGFGASVSYFPGASSGPEAAGSRYDLVPLERRIAVLPLEDLGGDDDRAYFSDGMTEEIISQLSRIEGLSVISRGSVMAYKGTDTPLTEIGRQLGVGRVLQGTVRYADGRVRISVELTDVATGSNLWADAWERTLEDVFVIQGDIASRLARSLSVELSPAVEARLGTRPTSSPEAYDAYLRARHFWSRRTSDGLERAVALFQEAIASDSTFALAYTGIAQAYLLLPQYGSMAPGDALTLSREALRQAVAADPDVAAARTALGFIASNYDRDWETAENEFLRAIELDPNDATAHHWYALSLLLHGRLDDALVEMEMAQRLDPLSVIVSSDAGLVRRLVGRPEDALEPLARALELDPDLPDAHLNLGLSYAAMGWSGEAIDALQRAVYLTGRHSYALGVLGIALADAGETAQAREILDELEQRSLDEFVSPALLGVLEGMLGDLDGMYARLGRADEIRDLILMTLIVDPALAERFGDDPRWGAALERARGT